MTGSLVSRPSGRGRTVPLLFVAAGVGLLGGAMFIEYGMGIAPCVLCLYQRIPPAVVVLLGTVALSSHVSRAWARRLTALVGVTFLAGAVLAGYHVGVEQHWWPGTEQCGGVGAPPPTLSTNLADLRAALDAPEVVPCDAVPWSLFGISLAGYNMLISLLLAVLAAWVVRQPANWRQR